MEETKKIIVGIQQDVKNQLANFSRYIDVMRDDVNYTKTIIARLNSEIQIIRDYTAFKANLRSKITELFEKYKDDEEKSYDVKMLDSLCSKYSLLN